jgi:hypothetical protein
MRISILNTTLHTVVHTTVLYTECTNIATNTNRVRLSMINLWCATLAAYGQSTIVFLVYGARSDVAEQWRATLFKNRSAVQSHKPNGNRRNGGYGCTKRQQRQRAAAAAQQLRQQQRQRAPRSSVVVTSGTKDGLSSQAA